MPPPGVNGATMHAQVGMGKNSSIGYMPGGAGAVNSQQLVAQGSTGMQTAWAGMVRREGKRKELWNYNRN
jgi:hypothetical protein